MSDLNNLTQIRDVSASEVVTDKMSSYGRDVIIRTFPHAIDGMKHVHRLVLYTTRNVKNTVGFISQLGNIMALHPAGDATIYEAIVRMGQPFKVGEPLITIDGYGGEYHDPIAAQPRYLGISSSEFAQDVFFDRCDMRTIPTMPSKDWQSMIPIYLIPCIPTALLLSNVTVGLGFNSTTPQIGLSDVCDLVMRQMENQQSNNGLLPTEAMAKYLIPDYPTEGTLRNSRELLQEYQIGNYKAPIYLDGKLEIKGNTIILRSMTNNANFGKTLGKVMRLLADKKHSFWLYDLLKTFPKDTSSSEATKVVFEFKNNVDIFSILEKFKALLKVTGAVHPKYNYVYNNKMFDLSPRSLLKLWYTERARSILGSIKISHAEISHDRLKIMAMLIVCDHVDEVIQIVRQSKTNADTVGDLQARFPELTRAQSVIITNMNLGSLNKQGREGLLAAKEQLEARLQDIQRRYVTIDERIYNDAQFIKKKWRKPRFTKLAENYIGYVSIDGRGIIQFQDEAELQDILTNNHNVKNLTVHHYHPYLPHRKAIYEGKVVTHKGDMYPEMAANTIAEYPYNPYTFYRIKDTTAFIQGFTLGPTKAGKLDEEGTDGDLFLQYTTKSFFGIHRNGDITESKAEDFSLRKSISRGAKSSLIYTLPRTCKNMLIAHMDPSAPNQIRIDRILEEPGNLGRCSFVPGGRTIILDIQPIGIQSWWLNLPHDCLYKLIGSHCVLRNPGNMFVKDRNTEILYLNKANSRKPNQRLKKHPVLPKVMIMEIDKP